MKPGRYKSFHLPESRRHFNPQRDFKTEHVALDLKLDFGKKSVEGSCTLTLSPVRSGLKSIGLDGAELEVRKVAVGGAPADFEHDGKSLVVSPRGGFAGRAEVRVEYSTVPREGVYFTEPDKEHPEKEVQAWTHSETEFARYWFPCYDHPNERFTSELVMMVPKGMRVISNGRLLSVKDDGAFTTFHWKEDRPHPSYLTSFVAGAFGEITQDADGAKLYYYFPESKRKDVLRYFGETPRMIEVFGELTGVKYPYEKYAQTTVQDFIFGGMENFNATTLAMNYYPDERSEEDFQTSYASPHTNAVNLVAHELAHQWFGDLVTCVDWAHAWLNEAFATYFQALYLEKTRGVDTMRWDIQARADEYFDEDETEYRRTIVDDDYVFPDDVFDYHLYEKGASMIHELRFIMGDEAFFRGVSQYLKAFSYSNADSHDLRKQLEKSSGLQLEEFFEQALYRTGYPELEVGYSWDEVGRLATVRVKQTQRLEAGTPIFKLPCEIVFYVDGERKRFRVNLDAAEQTFSFSLTGKPSIVELDPERWLLKKVKFDKSLALLVNQLSGSRDAWSRAEAAKALGKLRGRTAIGPLAEAAAKEQFWDVRACALRALGEIGGDEALAALHGLQVPKERRTRRALAEALGNFKDEKSRGALLEMLHGDPSPYVRCEAALSIAKAWPEGALAELKKAMTYPSPNETLGEACLDAMGKLKTSDVDSTVMENLAYGRPTRVRIGALKAIKGRGSIKDDEVPVLRDILLRDNEFRVRVYLVGQVIRPLGDRRFVDAVREASVSDKDPRVKRRALETYYELATSTEVSAAVSRLKAEVEELKDENRRLSSPAA